MTKGTSFVMRHTFGENFQVIFIKTKSKGLVH